MLQRSHLLDSTARLEKSSDRLDEGYRIAQETEEIGLEIMDNLQRDRETIDRMRGRVSRPLSIHSSLICLMNACTYVYMYTCIYMQFTYMYMFIKLSCFVLLAWIYQLPLWLSGLNASLVNSFLLTVFPLHYLEIHVHVSTPSYEHAQ